MSGSSRQSIHLHVSLVIGILLLISLHNVLWDEQRQQRDIGGGFWRNPGEVVGVPPNLSGTTYIDRDTEWHGTLFAGGDVVIGSSSQAVGVTWRDCNIQVNGSILIDNLISGFKPITLRIDRCTVSLGLSTSEIRLDYSDPAISGTNQGSAILISNSTIRSIFNNPPFPSGMLLLSGAKGYNLARVQIADTTFANLGRWDTGRTTISTRQPGSSAYSRFTPDSYLRRLTFISVSSQMNQLTHPGFLLLGDSLRAEDSTFIEGFLAVGNTKSIKGNTFNLNCRPVYDPLPDAVIENNTIYGKYCKTVDFFHERGTFRNNTVYDSLVGAGAPSAVGMRIINNNFYRSRTGGTAPYQEFRNNTISGLMLSDAGEHSIGENGNFGIIVGNRITNIATTGIKVEPYLLGYMYQYPTITDNVVDGFFETGDLYPGIKIKMTDGGIVRGNLVSNGYLGILLDTATNMTLKDNIVTNVTAGIKIRNSNNVTMRDSVLQNGAISAVLAGGNRNIRFVSVKYDSVSFADAFDVLQYYDYVDVFLPTTNLTQLSVRNNSGAVVYALAETGGTYRNIELHLFNQTQSSLTGFNPFSFEVTGLLPNMTYPIMKDGVLSQVITAAANGIATFQENITARTAIVMVESPDIVAPARISDLRAKNVGSGAWDLAWTAPGDDDMNGSAYRYEVRYSNDGPINTTTWNSAKVFPQIWEPLPAGSTEQHTIRGLDANKEYWFALRALDEVFNWGNVSNSALLPRQNVESQTVSLRILPDRVVTRADVTVRLTAMAYDLNGYGIVVSPIWTAENGTISSDGMFDPWATGYWNVCATYRGFSSCAVITVTPGNISELAVYPSPLRLKVDESVQLTIGAFDVRGNAVTTAALAWRVDPPELGRVTERNVFVAQSEGEGFLHLEATDKIVTQNATIDVTIAPLLTIDSGRTLGLNPLTFLATIATAVSFTVSLVGTSRYALKHFGRNSASGKSSKTEEWIFQCPSCETTVSESDRKCPGCDVEFED